MNRRIQKMIFVGGWWAAIALGQSAPVKPADPMAIEQEARKLTRPHVGVLLLQASRQGLDLRPTQAVVDSNSGDILFSDEKKLPDKKCNGVGLYRLPTRGPGVGVPVRVVPQRAGDEKSEPITTPLCIDRIFTWRERVFLRMLGDHGRELWHWTGKYLEAPLANIDGEFTAQWEWKSQLFSEVESKPLAPLSFWSVGLIGKRLSAAVESPAATTNPALLTMTVDGNDAEEIPGLVGIPPVAGKRVVDVRLDELGTVYVLSQMDGFAGTSSLVSVNGLTKTIGGPFGAATPITQDKIWNSLPAAQWAARSVQALTTTVYGVLLGDTTREDNEFPLIAYFSPYRRVLAFDRVRGLKENYLKHLRSLSSTGDGFVAAFPELGKIAYFGRANPYLEKDFESRRPSLDDITRDEYRKLLNEVKNGDATTHTPANPPGK
jgi:hypothetical protein